LSLPPDPDTDSVLDFDRRARIGLVEAVFCERKSVAQIETILRRFHARDSPCLLTRLDANKAGALEASYQEPLDYDPVSLTAFAPGPLPPRDGGRVALVSGGTSDARVCLEAARTLAFHGIPCDLYQDVGVTGLWRLTQRIEEIRPHPVVIAVAGMEGALFSVLGGLVGSVVIAVPTSVGYGVAREGELALHAALSSCAPGVVAVNIDNGYGAACAAIRVLGLDRGTSA
jgi:NCAIR mutase (PurE)-related protein